VAVLGLPVSGCGQPAIPAGQTLRLTVAGAGASTGFFVKRDSWHGRTDALRRQSAP